MPEHLKTLAIILVLAIPVFVFSKTPACELASTAQDFERRRNLWISTTLIAFLANNFWIFIVATAILLLLAAPRDSNRLALYCFLLFAVPSFGGQITGLGIITHFFTLNYLRLLALALLLPTFFTLYSRPETEPFGRSLPDKLIAGYIILQILLMLSISTFTNTLRTGVFYAFIDIFLPYYVASRSQYTVKEVRDTLMSFVVAAMVLSAVAVFEFIKHWLLYAPLDQALGVEWGLGHYLEREDNLRAQGSTGQPIILGYVIAVALGFYLYLRKSIANPATRYLGLACLVAGLIASLSRGPWIGAAAMPLVFILTGPSAGKNLSKLGLSCVLMLPVLLLTSVGEKIIDYLPFVGTVEESTVFYRQRLLEISIQVIMQNPLFGAYDYVYSPAMEELKQGASGFLDMVNSYLGVALGSGLVGLFLFVGFFVSVGIEIFKAMRSIDDKDGEVHRMGQALLATLIGIMVIIFTASSIACIPIIYWVVTGIGVAYSRVLVPANLNPEIAPSSPGPHGLGSGKFGSHTAQTKLW